MERTYVNTDKTFSTPGTLDLLHLEHKRLSLLGNTHAGPRLYRMGDSMPWHSE
jgi:hypothetical protein